MPVFGIDLFKSGLEELGYPVNDRGANRVSFPLVITEGRFKGSTVEVGIEVPGDFDVTCPTGPHITPRLIPINPNGSGNDRAADSPFGPDWEYLSRPFSENQQGWNRVKRGVRSYLRHVKRILETL